MCVYSTLAERAKKKKKGTQPSSRHPPPPLTYIYIHTYTQNIWHRMPSLENWYMYMCASQYLFHNHYIRLLYKQNVVGLSTVWGSSFLFDDDSMGWVASHCIALAVSCLIYLYIHTYIHCRGTNIHLRLSSFSLLEGCRINKTIAE